MSFSASPAADAPIGCAPQRPQAADFSPDPCAGQTPCRQNGRALAGLRHKTPKNVLDARSRQQKLVAQPETRRKSNSLCTAERQKNNFL